MASLPNGDNPGPQNSLRTSIDTLRVTLLRPATTEHKKLPKDTTPLHTIVHNSWKHYFRTHHIPKHKTHSYNTLASASNTNASSEKRTRPPIPDTLPTPDSENPASPRYNGDKQPQNTPTPNDLPCNPMENGPPYREKSLQPHPQRPHPKTTHTYSPRGRGHLHPRQPI